MQLILSVKLSVKTQKKGTYCVSQTIRNVKENYFTIHRVLVVSKVSKVSMKF